MAEASENTRVIQIGKGALPKLESAEQASSTLKAKLKELEAKRAEVKPSWWKEWEASSSQQKS